MGIILDIFRSFGIMPSCIDLLNIDLLNISTSRNELWTLWTAAENFLFKDQLGALWLVDIYTF